MGDKSKISKKYFDGLLKETEVHLRLNHENIIKLYNAFYEEDQFYLIMEIADGGDMEDVVKKVKNGMKLKEEVIWEYMR